MSGVCCIILPKFSSIHLLVKVHFSKRRLRAERSAVFLKNFHCICLARKETPYNNAYLEAEGSLPGLSSMAGGGIKYFASYRNNLP
jgi:hypothetical protein